MQAAVKSAFPKTVIANGAPKASPAKPSPSTITTDEIIVVSEFWLEVVNRTEKAAPFWAYLGDPRSADFGKRCVACLNIEHWPVPAALAKKDLRAVKWFVALAICERVSLETHPLVCAIRFRLAQLALARPVIHPWESVLWSAFALKDNQLFAGLESAPLTAGTLHKFGELAVRVSSSKLAQWKERNEAKRYKKRPLSAKPVGAPVGNAP
jgi:hypothetical protein